MPYAKSHRLSQSTGQGVVVSGSSTQPTDMSKRHDILWAGRTSRSYATWNLEPSSRGFSPAAAAFFAPSCGEPSPEIVFKVKEVLSVQQSCPDLRAVPQQPCRAWL